MTPNWLTSDHAPENPVERPSSDAPRPAAEPTRSLGDRVPALSRGVAIALHLWFGLMILGWLYTEWLVARSDGEDGGAYAWLLAILVATWVAATVLVARLHPRSARLAWIPILTWLGLAAVGILAV